MDNATIENLRKLNCDFYDSNAASFSSTRQRPWDGWKRVAQALPEKDSLTVLDVACGNMRFEKFLVGDRNRRNAQFTCVDSCAQLSVEVEGCSFIHHDIIGTLIEGTDFHELFEKERFDAVVSFGFMHHVPSARLRQDLLSKLVQCASSGGLVALSFWRFADDAKAREKALKSTAHALESLPFELEAGDYLLGWQNREAVYRYCHSFSDGEVNALVDSVASSARLVDRFRADGSTGAKNEYLVLKRI